MATNKLNENESCANNRTVPIQLKGGCCVYNCLRDVCGGEYKGCSVGGWINGDGDTTNCTDCSSSRFKPPC